MIWQLCLQTWSGNFPPQGEVEKADCVIGFSFGRIDGGPVIQPGPSNEDLACFVRDHLAALPKILQWEIADAYGCLCPGDPVIRISQHRQPNGYLDTREVAEQALQVMQTHGWQMAALLAQGHHLPRVRAVCHKLGMATVVPPGLERIRFCPGSTQPWTRNRVRWLLREMPAILFYRWKGWV